MYKNITEQEKQKKFKTCWKKGGMKIEKQYALLAWTGSIVSESFYEYGRFINCIHISLDSAK